MPTSGWRSFRAGERRRVLLDDGSSQVGLVMYATPGHVTLRFADHSVRRLSIYRVLTIAGKSYLLRSQSRRRIMRAEATIEGRAVTVEGGPVWWRVVSRDPVLHGAIVAAQDSDTFIVRSGHHGRPVR